MIKLDENTLTPEQKKAFQKGDKYYISPLKKYVRDYSATEFLNPISVFSTSNFEKLHEAEKDRNKSRSWN